MTRIDGAASSSMRVYRPSCGASASRTDVSSTRRHRWPGFHPVREGDRSRTPGEPDGKRRVREVHGADATCSLGCSWVEARQAARRVACVRSGVGSPSPSNVTPVFQIATSRSPLRSAQVWRPEAVAITDFEERRGALVHAGAREQRPASKSIQRGLACARALLLEIFSVGAGNPSGVPRRW